MEGLEISEVMLSYASTNNDIFRFDSNYFQKEYLREENLIRSKSFKTLKHLGASLLSFGAYSLNNFVDYKNEGVPFIRGVNMKEGRISFSDMIYIDEKTNSLLWKSEVKPEMVLLSMSGTIGDVALASKNWKYPINSNQDIAKINTNGYTSPYLLFAFLLGKFGQNYLNREARGSVQQHVFLSQIELFEIPLFSETFEETVQQIIEQSDKLLQTAEDIYTRSQTLLLETFGLKSFQPSIDTANVKRLSESFGKSGRLDAEYYQKKYDDLEKEIYKNLDYAIIGNIRTDNFRGLQPTYIEDGKLSVINSKHILEYALDYENFEKTDNSFWESQYRARVHKGDILTYTTGANIGRTQTYSTEEKAIASNHVNILRLKQGYNPFYVGFVMNSIIGRMQTDKFSAGSAQAELYPKDIDQFIIPFCSIETQNQIVQHLEDSLNLKRESKRLLALAKKIVEIAIEQNEKAAMNYINKTIA